MDEMTKYDLNQKVHYEIAICNKMSIKIQQIDKQSDTGNTLLEKIMYSIKITVHTITHIIVSYIKK